MTTSPNQSGTSRSRLGFIALLLLFAVGGAVFLLTRHPAPVTPTVQEVHRKDLQMSEGVWYTPGQSNAFTGLLFDSYDDGSVKSRSTVSNGLLEGLSHGWYTNGQQQVEEQFVAGVSHGLRTKWHSNGQKLSEVNIVNCKLEGTYRTWHDNGQPAKEVEMKDGQPDGLSKAWFPSGYLKAQVTMRKGEVVTQQFWNDGEHREAPGSAGVPPSSGQPAAPGQLTSK